MTLVVDFDEFPSAVQRYGQGTNDCVFCRKFGSETHFSYANPQNGTQVVCFYSGVEQKAREELANKGLCVQSGTWVTEASLELVSQLTAETYIAGVAYETKKGPGLWMDAFPTPPSEGTVLRAIFDEFVSEGILEEHSFEQFISECKPMVRILDPADTDRFKKQKAAPQ